MPYKDPADKAAHSKRYNAKPEQKKRRAERNGARRKWVQKLIAKYGDEKAKKMMAGKDVHHGGGKSPPSRKIGGTTTLVATSTNRNPHYGKKKA